MCTLAWGIRCERLWVCFNRDELLSRPDAERPEVYGDPGKRLAFARDPVGQGSWFVASERGFVVALLNNYPLEAEQGNSRHQSRGQLVLEVAQEDTPAEAENHLKQVDLKRFPPFHIFILSIDGSIAHTWDARELSPLSCPQKFWTTSSHFPESVVPWRNDWWSREISGKELDVESAGQQLQEYCSRNPAHGTTMDRNDARTVSQIQLEMDVSGFIFAYRRRDNHGQGFLPPEILHCSA